MTKTRSTSTQRVTASIAGFLAVAALLTPIALAGDLWSVIVGDKSSVARRIGSFRETHQYFASTMIFSADSTKIFTDNSSSLPYELHVRTVGNLSNYRPILVPGPSPLAGSPGGSALSVAISGNGALMAAAHASLPIRVNVPRDTKDPSCPSIQIWNAVDERPLLDLDPSSREVGCSVSGVALTHDGKLMFARVESASAKVCNNTAWHEYIAVFSTKDWQHLWNICTGSVALSTVSISPNDRFIAISGFSRVRPDQKLRPDAPMFEDHPIITLVDLSTRQVVREIDGAFPDSNNVMALAWSPDGKRLAAGGGVGGSYPGPDAVKIFDAMSGELVKAEQADNSWVTAIAYTSDGKYLVEGAVNKAVRIWDSAHEHLLQTISVKWGNGFSDVYTTLAISPDSRYLAISEWRQVTLYELK